MLEYILMGIASFWLALFLIVKNFNLEAKGVTILPPVFIMVRTRKFLHFMDSLSQKGRLFWEWYGRMGIAVSAVGIPLSMASLAYNAYKVIRIPKEAAPVIPVIPGVTIKVSWGLLLSIVVVFFVHEFSHGIIARKENISLKSMGVLLLVILPGAFVEPDEEEMGKKSFVSRIKVYSAGSTGNFVVAAIFLGLLMSIPMVPDGILINDTVPGTPAENVLSEGTIIYKIENADVSTYEQFSEELGKYKKGDTITLETNRGVVQITLAESPENPGKGYMGIKPTQHVKNFFIFDIVSWIFTLNFSIALFNLFPISRVLDGGKITDEVLRHYFSEDTSKKLAAAFGALAMAILIINLLSTVRT